MAQLLEGKTALVLGVANKWSIAYAISAAFVREGASLILTYQGERQRETVEELGGELHASKILPCDVTKPEELEALVTNLKQSAPVIDSLVHSIAFANREDLSRPFLETSRDGFLLAQEVSAYSLVAVARAIAPLMTRGGSITTLTYLGSTRVVQNYNVMGVAKASLEACVRYLAADMGPKRVESTPSLLALSRPPPLAVSKISLRFWRGWRPSLPCVTIRKQPKWPTRLHFLRVIWAAALLET